ncbi:MAG: sodium:proton antiporter [Verrucomicrobiales bacterium]|nr:sodium:proton antiporter [Verrucomicrobiales bacterium]
MIPFGIVLLAIAIGPTLFHAWWNKHYTKLTLGLAAITLLYYIFGISGGITKVFHTAHEYFGFIALIGSLYVVSGGIHIHVGREATPAINILFLLIGAVLANVLGTTGASMLMIRPWLRMNQHRAGAHHVVFFIFIVSNVGGCLTPIGDPPLFLGFLKGVPFWWVAEKCWPMWLVGIGFLLAIFYVFDRRNYARCAKCAEPTEPKLPHEMAKWRFEGLANLACLAIILAGVFVSKPLLVRETIMIAAALVSWVTTKKSVHDANHFNWHPLMEVVVLFAAIFLTMMPALDWLAANAQQAFGVPHVGTFYWTSGVLSSVLDNAPTYLAFFTMLHGGNYPGPNPLDPVLIAISIGAVFFGANTYIGNGPNFMVRSIASHRKIITPTFFGYIFKWTVPIMVPLLALLWFLFFR